VVRKIAGTKPRPRTVRPKKIGAGRMKIRPAPGKGPDPFAPVMDRTDKDRQPKQDQEARQHQREIARSHPERRADLKPKRLDAEEQSERMNRTPASASVQSMLMLRILGGGPSRP
jgi:hypothetical protein